MKAQAYELGALPQRKNKPSVYQFNLLSIVDSSLVRLMFKGTSVTESAIDDEDYIARYIIRKRETFSRIRFITAAHFPTVLPDYSALHKANCKWFDVECDAFYKDIFKDSKRVRTLLDDFRARVRWDIRFPLTGKDVPDFKIESVTLCWDEGKGLVQVSGPFSATGVAVLNQSTQARKGVSKALIELFRYSGDLEFVDDDIPF